MMISEVKLTNKQISQLKNVISSSLLQEPMNLSDTERTELTQIFYILDSSSKASDYSNQPLCDY